MSGEPMHLLDAAVALAVQPDGSFLGHTHPAWANMIGPFGGITAAQAINAVLQHPQLLGDPIAFTVNFAAALADGPFTARAVPARTNRSTQHWTITLAQGDHTVVTATAVTALRRPTWGVPEASMPEVPRPADVPRTPRAGVEWLKCYDMRFLAGMLPRPLDGRDQGNSISRLWVRDDPPRPLDFAALTAMSDIFFPRMWLRRASMVPMGTITMSVYFHADAQQLQACGTGYLLAQARGQQFSKGYFDHSGQLWNEAGALIATTHQMVYYKE